MVRVDTEGKLAYGAYIPTVLPTPPAPEAAYAPMHEHLQNQLQIKF